MNLFSFFQRNNDRFKQKPATRHKEILPKPAVWEFPKTKERDTDGYYPIICPYCFERFHIWEAEFRSAIPYMNTGGDTSGFALEVDNKYEDFERYIGGQQSFMHRGKVLRIFDDNGEPTGEVTHITLMDRQQGGNDKDGIRISIEGRSASDFEKAPIMSVINKYGQLCTERICPHCHHRVSDFVGIWPSYTVALIGDITVGKAVYLHKLRAVLTTRGILDRSLIGKEADPDYKSWISSAMEMNQRTHENKLMAELTITQFMPPNIIEFYNTQLQDGFILYLQDFPGDALRPIRWGGNGYYQDSFRAHTMPRIERIDAFMFMFDSASFETVQTVFKNDDDLKPYIADRLNSVSPIEILNYFEIQYLIAHRNQFTKPLAIIMSKSDLIKMADAKDKDYFPNLSEDQRFLDPNPNINRDRKKVDLDDINQCMVEIESFVQGSKRDSLLFDRCSSDQENGESCWFALSSKGDATNAAAEPIRITEPLEWILWRLGLVQGEGNHIPGGGNPRHVE